MNEPGKYSVIYADPPWQYRVWSKKGTGRSAESHYSTMSLEDIKALPVHLLAAKDCTLFLWVTFPLLKEAWPVLEAWGFTYKSVAFVWVKLNRKASTLFTGMGYRLRTYRHKAYYSLDRDDGLEHEAVFVALSPHELYERKVTMQELHAAIASLPDKQAKRIYAHFILGMTKQDIARAEGVHEKVVRVAIERGLRHLEKILKNSL